MHDDPHQMLVWVKPSGIGNDTVVVCKPDGTLPPGSPRYLLVELLEKFSSSLTAAERQVVETSLIGHIESINNVSPDYAASYWRPHADACNKLLALRNAPDLSTVSDETLTRELAARNEQKLAKLQACSRTNEAVRAMLAAQQPPDLVKELRKAWNANREHGWHDRMEAAIAALETTP